MATAALPPHVARSISAPPSHGLQRPQSERVAFDESPDFPRAAKRSAFRRQISSSAFTPSASSALSSPRTSLAKQGSLAASSSEDTAAPHSFSSRYLRRVHLSSKKLGALDTPESEGDHVGSGGAGGGGDTESPDDGAAFDPARQQTYLDHGIRYFNLNPKAGLKFLVERKVIRNRDVAEFLKDTRGLNKVQIGIILGDESPEGRRRLKDYVALFDFSGFAPAPLGVEQALRSMLKCFKPSGDAQKIERVLMAFAEKFSQDVSGALSVDTVNQLAYIVVLVNVDLHNPNNTHKMTKEDLFRSTNAMPDLSGIAAEEFSALYDSILASEIKHVADREDLMGNLFTQPAISGQLEIRSKGSSRFVTRTTWRSRFFVLSKNTLYYFKRASDPEPRGFIPLQDVIVQSREAAPRFGFASASEDDDSSTLLMARSLAASAGGRLASACPSVPSSPFSRHSSSGAQSPSGLASRFALLPSADRQVIKSAKISKTKGLVNLEHASVELRASSREMMEEWIRAIQQNVIASGQPASTSRADGFLTRFASLFGETSPQGGGNVRRHRSAPSSADDLTGGGGASMQLSDLSLRGLQRTNTSPLADTGDLAVI